MSYLAEAPAQAWGGSELAENLVASSFDGILAFDRDFCCSLWNPAMQRITGLRAADVLGRRTFDVLPFLLRTGEDLFFFDALRGKPAVSHGRSYFVEESGRAGDFEAAYSPLRDETGAIVGGLCILRDITKRQRAESELRRLSERLLRLQDEERRRMARELHDATGQNLTALIVSLSALRDSGACGDPAARRGLADSIALARQCSLEIRTFCYLLHPPLLEEFGLAGALENYIDGYRQRTGIAASLELPPTLGRLNPQMETAIFRIVQECLTNIHRHSGSPTAHIHLALAGEDVVLDVEDRGRGMQPGASGQAPEQLGVGIAGMRERARQLGGRLEIRSSPAGTRVNVRLPLRANQQHETASNPDCG